MIDSYASWQFVASVQAAVTVLCAAVTAGHFLCRLPRESRSGRRTASLALILAALGDIAQFTALMSWHVQPSLVVASGLPVCIGQALMAGMVVRESMDR